MTCIRATVLGFLFSVVCLIGIDWTTSNKDVFGGTVWCNANILLDTIDCGGSENPEWIEYCEWPRPWYINVTTFANHLRVYADECPVNHELNWCLDPGDFHGVHLEFPGCFNSNFETGP